MFSCENSNEKFYLQLEEQLPFAVQILEQALGLTEDMVLPSAPSLAATPKTTELSEQERASDEGVPASDDQEQNLEVDDPNNSETESKAVVKNGSDEKNGSDAVESLDSNTMEDVKIKREDIVAQVWKFSHNQIIICGLVFLKNSEFSSSHFG